MWPGQGMMWRLPLVGTHKVTDISKRLSFKIIFDVLKGTRSESHVGTVNVFVFTITYLPDLGEQL